MKVEKTMNYTLHINEDGQYGIDYINDLDNDMAGLLISLQVLEQNLLSLQEVKKSAKGREKANIAKQISSMSQVTSGLKQLVINICANYETYKLALDLKEKKESLNVK